MVQKLELLTVDDDQPTYRYLDNASVSLESIKWLESPNRPAGYRQELNVAGKKWGFCWIPSGEFEMGSPASEQEAASESAKYYNSNLVRVLLIDGKLVAIKDPQWVYPDYKDERQHHVKLSHGFWLLETPVTEDLWESVRPGYFPGYSEETTTPRPGLPICMLSYSDALEFCHMLTGRLPSGLKATLPTEAQWEYACRAGTTTLYWFGDSLNGDEANCDGNYPFGTEKKGKRLGQRRLVKEYAKNPFGLFDMHGNVCEWCLDWYGEYPSGTVTDPKGPSDGHERVFRGGRSAARGRCDPFSRVSNYGFRVLLSCD